MKIINFTIAFLLVWLAKKIGMSAQEFEKIVNDVVSGAADGGGDD